MTEWRWWGVRREELREKMRTERLMCYFRGTKSLKGVGMRQTDGWVRGHYNSKARKTG